MSVRRRAWLSREGWYYLAVLAFIVAGAILKNVNLLVALAGMMIAPLIINWRLVMANLSGLVVRRKLPEQICAGEPLTVEIVAENSRHWMSSWLISIEDWVKQLGEEDASERRQETGWRGIRKRLLRLYRAGGTRGHTVIAHVPARGRAIGTYRITIHRRGRYEFGPLRISTRFPLGLVWGQSLQTDRAEVIVAPRLGRLSSEWLRLIEAALIGDQHRHPQRGVSEGDYYGLRPWQSGDSMRWIHWRTTAKMGRPIVRQFERQRNRDVALLLDPWLPCQPTERDDGNLELAISLAATALADLTSRGHSRLTLVLAGSAPRCFSGPASAFFCQEMLAQLADLRSSDASSLGPALRELVAQAPRGSRLVVISPRPASALAVSEESVDLDCHPDNLSWIDASSEQLSSLFTVE
jgi:uncharacterized protein (DUF58 family)